MESFDEWVNNGARNYMDVWDISNGVIIGTSPTFLRLFNGVIDYLKEQHQNNCYHGNIRDSIQISSTETELVRQPGWIPPAVLGKRHRRYNTLFTILHVKIREGSGVVGYTIANGILKDIQDLRAMVGDLVNFFPAQIPLWNLFQTGAIYLPPAVLNLWTVKKMAIFNYSHPIFLNETRSCSFVHKLHEIRARKPSQFKRDVCLDAKQQDSNMLKWHRRLRKRQRTSLSRVLYDSCGRFQRRFYRSYQFPVYMRIVCEHARDHDPHAWAGDVFRELREVFPDGLARIHVQLCTKLNDDVHCIAAYGADIFWLIGDGPHGYPGLGV